MAHQPESSNLGQLHGAGCCSAPFGGGRLGPDIMVEVGAYGSADFSRLLVSAINGGDHLP